LIKNVASHKDYQAFVKEYLSVLFLARGQLPVLLLYQDVFAKLWLTDLSPAISHLVGLYATSGRPARDPVALFRSLLLMRVLKVDSMDVWSSRCALFLCGPFCLVSRRMMCREWGLFMISVPGCGLALHPMLT